MRYVGISQSKYKTYLVSNYKKGNRIKVPVERLISKDCDRHLELLAVFDEIKSSLNKYRPIIKRTKYYAFQKINHKTKKQALRKISKFYDLYRSIKKHGYISHKGSPIVVSHEGARLDGSHRAAILYHLGVQHVKIITIDWNKFLRPRILKRMRKHLNRQRIKYEVIL